MSSIAPPSSTWGMTSELGFPLFPKLPMELRILVWTAAASIPRIITIRRGIGQDLHYANLTVPVILHTSQEARKAAKDWYTRISSGHLGHLMYINFTNDVLFFPHPRDLFLMVSPLGRVSEDLQTNIHNVMIGNKAYNEGDENDGHSGDSRLSKNTRMWRKLQNFRSLTSLTLNMETDPHELAGDPRKKNIASFQAARRLVFCKGMKMYDELPEFKFLSIENMNAMAQKSYEGMVKLEYLDNN